MAIVNVMECDQYLLFIDSLRGATNSNIAGDGRPLARCKRAGPGRGRRQRAASWDGCRWALLRVLNAFHLVLSLGTMILLVITIVQNRFGMCEDC